MKYGFWFNKHISFIFGCWLLEENSLVFAGKITALAESDQSRGWYTYVTNQRQCDADIAIIYIIT